MNDTFSWPLELFHNLWIFLVLGFMAFLFIYHIVDNKEEWMFWKKKKH